MWNTLQKQYLSTYNIYLLKVSSAPTLIVYMYTTQLQPQSRQSARLPIQSSELGPLTPTPARGCCPPPSLCPGGRHSRLRGRGCTPWGGDDRHSVYSRFLLYTIISLRIKLYKDSGGGKGQEGLGDQYFDNLSVYVF
jgi:hypothetical protein